MTLPRMVTVGPFRYRIRSGRKAAKALDRNDLNGATWQPLLTIAVHPAEPARPQAPHQGAEVSSTRSTNLTRRASNLTRRPLGPLCPEPGGWSFVVADRRR